MTEEENEVVEETVEETVEPTEVEETTEVVEEPEVVEETPDPKDAEIAKLSRQLKQAQKKTQTNKPSEDRDIRDIANDVNALTGESDDIVSTMEMVAKAKGISLTEAKKDPTVVALKEKQERDDKSAEAGLGGSGKGIQKSTPDYVENESKEDHRKKWKAATGN